MKKLSYLIYMSIAILVFVNCGGQEKKLQSFASTFANYVNSHSLDSIKTLYPSINFEPIGKLNSEGITVTKEENNIWKINYNEDCYISVTENENGSFYITNSHGLADLPIEKLEIAEKTGMINPEMPDEEKQSLLNDTVYFNWLFNDLKNSYNNALTLKAGKAKTVKFYGEGNNLENLTCEITNNLPDKLSKDQYEIKYTIVYYGEESNNWKDIYKTGSKEGEDIEAGQTIQITITQDHCGTITKPQAVLNFSIDEYVAKYYKPQGNEYQKFLDLNK